MKRLLPFILIMFLLAACKPATIQSAPEPDTMGSNYQALPFDWARKIFAQAPPAEYFQGIDVSRWQGSIDHAAICGGFVFVRASAADSYGNIYTDSRWHENAQGFTAAGIPFGAYHFFRPNVDPSAQADELANALVGYDPLLPAVLDVEVNGGVSPSGVRAAINTFASRFQYRTGQTIIIYTSPGFWNSSVSRGNTPWELWVAHWGVSAPTLPYDWSDYLFWQWDVVSDGAQCGVESQSLDHNVYHGTEQQFHERFPDDETPPVVDDEFPQRIELDFITPEGEHVKVPYVRDSE